jgi:hypothetical protein
MAPFDVATHFGVWAENLTYLAVGFAFGFILERAGFGSSRKLVAQFYLHDMTVLKVMFTGIIVCMLLTFWAVGLQWIDFGRVFVNPTFLGSGILGGLLLGMGFIIGGFCPGTALVAVGTLKLDGLFFLLGVLLGIFVFGEAAPLLWGFFEQSGSLGRYTLADWLRLDYGVVVLLVVLMALAMFFAAERIEAWSQRRMREAGTRANPKVRTGNTTAGSKLSGEAVR